MPLPIDTWMRCERLEMKPRAPVSSLPGSRVG